MFEARDADHLVTDADWRFALTEEEGFATLRFDDRNWQQVAVLGGVKRGMNVWGMPPKTEVAPAGR